MFVVIVAGYFAVLATRWLAGDLQPWRMLGVPQLTPAFADTYNVLSAVDCLRQGYDPLAVNPCDFVARPMNYPRAWLLLERAGAGVGWTNVVGSLLGIGFLAGCMLWMGRTRVAEGAMVAVLVCSPSIMLLVERGNVDALVFLVCIASIPWLARPARGKALGQLGLLGAAVLKLFPAFALPAVAWTGGSQRRRVMLAVAGCIAFVAYAWAIRSDLLLIRNAVPRSSGASYGAAVLAMRFLGGRGTSGEMVYLGLSVLAGATGWLLGGRRWLPGLSRKSYRGAGFVCGALVFAGTFALGTHWAYRVAFLLLVVPQVLEWMREGGTTRAWGIVLYGVITVIAYALAPEALESRWLGGRVELALFCLVQVLTWGLAITGTVLVAAWAREEQNLRRRAAHAGDR